MNVKNLLAVPQVSSFTDVALLLARFVAGIGLMLHGWPKIQNPFGWMGDGAPGIFQALAALSEFGGGLALVVGFLTPLSLLGIACTMGVAVYMHAIVKGDPFVGKGGSYELAALYFSLAILLLAVGAGRFSLDRAIFGSRR